MGRSTQPTPESAGSDPAICINELIEPPYVKTIDVCLTPALLSQHDVREKVVVVVDILRATSTMVTAFAHGMAAIRPVAQVEECRALQHQGYLTAGERDGIKIEDFDFGNSPFDYQQDALRGKSLAMTTTNGTVAIEQAKGARELIIGAFLNIRAVRDHIRQQEHDVLVVCAGWKGHVNLEDTLFAGALLTDVSPEWQAGSDAALLAKTLYTQAQTDCLGFLAQSAHVQRLGKMGLQRDIEFCLGRNVYPVVPRLRGEQLVVPAGQP